MPLNVHDKEHLQTYAQNISWVSQGSFELSSIDTDASGFIHADQGIRLSANNAELIITGESDATAAFKTTPFILGAVPSGGSILLNGNNGDAGKVSILQVGNNAVQAMAGTVGKVSSFIVDEDLIEGIAGVGLTSLTSSKISIKPSSISLQTNELGSIEISPTSIKLSCGVPASAASIELKATGEITLKAGPTTELSLDLLEAKIKALESLIKLNAAEIKQEALTLKRNAKLIAKDTATLIQNNTKAIADIKSSLENRGGGGHKFHFFFKFFRGKKVCFPNGRKIIKKALKN